VGRAAIGGEGVERAHRESDALAGGDQPFRRAVRKRDQAVVFLEQYPHEAERPAHVLAQGLAAGGREELVGVLGLRVADRLVEELGAGQRMGGGHGLAQQIVLDGAQGGPDLALDVGAGVAKDEIHRDLIEAEFGEIVVERWSCFFDQIAAQLRWIRVSYHAAIFVGSVWLA